MSAISAASDASTLHDTESVCSKDPPGGPVDHAEIIKNTASEKMLLILQCVGSIPASQNLAHEMNEVLATVDAIARQRSFAREDEDEEEEGEGGRAVIEMADEEDGEKTEVMKQAAAYLASARIDKRVGHLVVKIKGVAEGNVCRIVCVIKAIMTASSSAGIQMSIALHDPEKLSRTAMIEVLQPDEEDPDQELSEEEQKEALLQHLDLLPDKDLKFIEEEVVSFVDNPERVSRNMRIILQALDAAHRTPELAEDVEYMLEAAEARKGLSRQALDFSYLVDLDKDTGTAKLRFDLASDELAETLAVIRLVLDSCVEAGAELLAVELVDGDKHAVVAVSPYDCSASVKLSVVDPRCATSVQAPPFPEGEEEEEEAGAPSFAKVMSCSVDDVDAGSRSIRVVLEALGAIRRSRELVQEVEEVLARAKEARGEAQALDFSYLMDVDEESGRAQLRFDLSEEGGKDVAETLAVIQVVLSSCVEAGARLLTVELADGPRTAHVTLTPLEAGGAAPRPLPEVPQRLKERSSVPRETWVPEAEIGRVCSFRSGRLPGEAELAIVAFVALRPDQVEAGEGEGQLFELGHQVLDVGKEWASEEAERQRTVCYEAVMQLLEAEERVSPRRLKVLQLHMDRLLHLLHIH